MIRRKIGTKKISKLHKYIIILFISALLITFSVSFGRYVYKQVLNLYFTTKNFYFESNKLKSNEATYTLNYWNGVDPYTVVVDLNSFKNDILKSNNDIEYTTSYVCPNNVICDLSKTSGTIDGDVNTDSFTFTMTPDAIFDDNDRVTFKIIATSTSPYVKTLSASFTLVVGKYGLGHEIVDHTGDPYLSLKVTNTLDSYVVKEAFGDYQQGNHISESAYNELSAADKAKCASAIITVAFDPNVVKIDNTATAFLNAYNIENQQIGGYDYVKKFTFDMDASMSSVVKFYKKNKNVDYSNSNVLTVTYSY